MFFFLILPFFHGSKKKDKCENWFKGASVFFKINENCIKNGRNKG